MEFLTSTMQVMKRGSGCRGRFSVVQEGGVIITVKVSKVSTAVGGTGHDLVTFLQGTGECGRLTLGGLAVKCIKKYEGWHGPEHHPYVAYGHRIRKGKVSRHADRK